MGVIVMILKRVIALLIVLILSISMVGCKNTSSGQDSKVSGETYKIKIANWHAPDHPINVGLNKFKEIVEKKTDGKVTVQIFPNSQLGPEDTYIDSVKKGNVEMGITGTLMGRDVPMINIGEMPFLFRDWDHAKKVFSSPLGDEITNGLIEKAGVRNLAWVADGFRVITSNKDISSFDKLNGMRLRVPNTPVYVEMAKGFGANPITMPFSEVFTALEQKVVDGQENPYATIRSSKIYEVQKYILESNHMFSPRLWIVNEQFFKSLPSEYQKIITDAAKEAADYEWQVSIEQEQKDKNFIESQGIKIIVPDESFKQKLIDSQKSMYDWFYNKYPGSKEMADKIRAVK
jgi:tripartite ATP-independent transporter DctP family solute receptor